MGRLLKRVPMDFNWPLKQVWKGYLSPYKGEKCITCDGGGYSKQYKKLQDEWYGKDEEHEGNRRWSNNLDKDDIMALIKNNRLWEFTRVPITEEHKKILEKQGGTRLPFNNGKIPTPEEVNKWSTENIIGLDSFDCYIVITAKLKRLKEPSTCPYCKGEGLLWYSEEVRELNRKFKPYEPRKGKGFQLWENTSEGSPISPVFKTLIELCEWCEGNATVFGKEKATKDEWLKMLDSNFVYHKEGNIAFI